MESNEPTTSGKIGATIQETVNRPFVVAFVVGIVAAYSLITLVTADPVALPVAGSVPGQFVGTVGLGAAAIAYQWTGCGTCGDAGDCGCTDSCGDSCSVKN